ncbi:MAG: ubiquinol-cytochrome c reductase iron-sulfur subunit [Actinobacteria bacterium]|nr:ubiquinol-cytochrome c reductase iron-sulfur subunit [Actinomycetota bacterium]MCL5883186.1 ubiquinol-cytochrome c reductase iron-sulfur subunit [Actinomycetota bacterium]
MIDDKSSHAPAPQPKESVGVITRRRFLSVVFAGATAIGLGAFAAPLVRYAYPVLQGQVFARQKVATTAQVTADGFKFDYMDTPSMVIPTSDGGFAAFSLVCTHLGCIVKWETTNHIFHCPCHAGKFDETGKNISGPPPKPLPKYNLSVEGTDIFVEGLAT